ncbi:MAG: M56 family metallopeptidase [Gammaproteobacteria bacterium]|nr:MAG: M56 family metallopeptidase [Gammaproteobacteria bacterium]
MNQLSQLLSHQLVHAIGWTIIHSLWQFSLIAILVATSYAFTKKISAAKRYWINIFGLVSCIVTSIVTFFLNLHDTVVIDIISNNVSDNSVVLTQSSYVESFHRNNLLEVFDKHVGKIVFIWMIGFSFYLTKYLTELFFCQKVKNHKNQSLDEQWVTSFNELKNCLGITQSIQLRTSEIVNVPCVIGHFKPMILLPVSMMLGLSHQQLDVILLHELAHIRRNDYLTKSLQTFITSIYFFNPFIHWLSSKIDEERENACDDVAVSVSGDPLFYANTLKEFAEMKENHTMIVAIAGSKKLLLNRIKRLFNNEDSFPKTYGKTLAFMGFFLFIASYSLTGFSDGGENDERHSFHVEKVALSEAILLAEQSCPDEIKLIKLKNPHRLVTADLKNVSCRKLAEFITRTDKIFKEKTFTSNFTDGNIDNILSQLSENCPGITENINIKRPSYLKITFVSDATTCRRAQHHIESRYLAATTVADESIIVNDGFGTAPYSDAIWPNLAIPTEMKVNADVKCDSLFSVDITGKPFEVSAKCISNSQDAALVFESNLITAINKTQFKPKVLNGKSFTMRNIHISNNFSVDEKYGVL